LFYKGNIMASIVVAGDTSGTVTLTAPATAGTTTLTLPTTDGTVITTGSTTGINASAISTGTLAKARLPASSILQVVQTIKTDTFTTSSSSYTDITGLSVNITPTSASNRILVIATLSYGGGTNAYGYAQILRNGTPIALGNSDSSNRTENTFPLNIENTPSGDAKLMNAGMTVLDSPATTSVITYKIQALSAIGTTVAINRSGGNSDNAFSGLGVSTITVMEIAG
jgi:hypothetical protein